MQFLDKTLTTISLNYNHKQVKRNKELQGVNTADIYFLMGRNEIEIHYEEKVNVNSYLLYCNNEHIFHFQLILKGNFSVFNSPKKPTWWCLFFALDYWGRIFCSFFGRIEKTKKPFWNELNFTFLRKEFLRSSNDISSNKYQLFLPA